MKNFFFVVSAALFMSTTVQAARLAPSDIPVRETPPSQPADPSVQPNYSGNINQINNPAVLENKDASPAEITEQPAESVVPVIEQPAEPAQSGMGMRIWILLGGLVVVALAYGFTRRHSDKSVV